MMMKHNLLVKLAALIAVLSFSSYCLSQTQSTQIIESAKQFVEHLYSLYGPSADPPNLFERNATQAFDPSLIALARADAKAAKPDVGVLDYDPVCNCQDTDVKFPNLKIMIRPIDASRTEASVSFTGYSNERNQILLTLVEEQGDWRIYNIEDLPGSSPHADLRSMLEKDIRELSREKSSR